MTAAWVAVEQLLEADELDEHLERGGSAFSFLELLLLERPSWMADAACAGADPAAFFPERGEDTGPALALCARCPVVDECRTYALEQPGRTDHGVWGGTSARERRRLRAGGKAVELEAEPAHLLTATQAAERIGVDRSAFSRWMRDGLIVSSGRRRSSGAYLFDPADVDRMRGR